MAGTQQVTDLYAVKFDTNVLGGVVQQAVNTGSDVRGESADGATFARIMSLVSQTPGAAFTTLSIANALDLCGLTGTPISGLGFFLYGHQHAPGGTRKGAGAHKEFKIPNGIVIPRTLSVDHLGDARISYEVMATFDGSNLPVIPSESVTLPTDPNDNERFTLGKTTIGGFLLQSMRSLEIDFGIDVQGEGGDSDLYPTFVSIRSIRPVLTIRGIDLDWFKTSGAIALQGLPATQANTTFFLRRRKDGGTFELDASALHIKFNGAGLVTVTTPQDAATGTPSEATITVPLNFDGTNAPLVIATDVAIS